MRLAVFDFDGTLFRSPDPPTWHDKAWFVEQASLSPPCVPQKPGPEWWVGPVYSAAKQATQDPETYAVLLTGRSDSVFRWRIPELLKMVGLDFDEVHLNPGGDTPTFKLRTMSKILSRFQFQLVELWDDKETFLNMYEKVLSKYGYEVIIHPVRAKSLAPRCSLGDLSSTSPRKIVYEAFVLYSNHTLLKWWSWATGRKLLPVLHANHVTTRISPGKISEDVGKEFVVRVTGWFDNGRVQGVLIKPFGFSCDNKNPHITIATAPGVSPKESNLVLDSGQVQMVPGPVLRGVLGASDGNKWYFKRDGMQKLSSVSKRSVALMRFLSREAQRVGVAQHSYVVGGAVRDWVLKHPIKDVDLVIDSVAAKMNSDQFAQHLSRVIPAATNLTTNQYGVAILGIQGDWFLEGFNMKGEQIEIANARKESYTGEGGKGYKPTKVTPTGISEDVQRREFSFNTLMWRLLDLTHGPEKAEIIDLTGCGLRDLQEGKISCPKDPDITFSDDPTRILRVFKFAGRYGFKIPEDVAISIRKNGHKLKKMPYHAVGQIFVRDILKGPKPGAMLKEMGELGLLSILRELAEENQAFSSYLYGQTKEISNPQLVLFLQKALNIRTPLSFLNPGEIQLVERWLYKFTPEQRELFISSLKKPNVNNLKIISTLSLPPEERGRIAKAARYFLVRFPRLMRRDLTPLVIGKIRKDMSSGF